MTAVDPGKEKNATHVEKPEKTDRELRDFGFVMSIALTLICAFGVWKTGRFGKTAYVLLALTGFFTYFGILAPRVLRPIEKYWMIFAEKLGSVMTVVIMAFTFIFMVIPLGFLLKILGKDLLQRRIEPERESYWLPVEADGPGSRPYTPF